MSTALLHSECRQREQSFESEDGAWDRCGIRRTTAVLQLGERARAGSGPRRGGTQRRRSTKGEGREVRLAGDDRENVDLEVFVRLLLVGRRRRVLDVVLAVGRAGRRRRVLLGAAKGLLAVVRDDVELGEPVDEADAGGDEDPCRKRRTRSARLARSDDGGEETNRAPGRSASRGCLWS